MNETHAVIASCYVCGYDIIAGLPTDDPQRIVRVRVEGDDRPEGTPHHAKCVGGLPFVSDADYERGVREGMDDPATWGDDEPSTDGHLGTFSTTRGDVLGVVGSDPLTDSTISMYLPLDEAENFARQLLAEVAAKREATEAAGVVADLAGDEDDEHTYEPADWTSAMNYVERRGWYGAADWLNTMSSGGSFRLADGRPGTNKRRALEALAFEVQMREGRIR